MKITFASALHDIDCHDAHMKITFDHTSYNFPVATNDKNHTQLAVPLKGDLSIFEIVVGKPHLLGLSSINNPLSIVRMERPRSNLTSQLRAVQRNLFPRPAEYDISHIENVTFVVLFKHSLSELANFPEPRIFSPASDGCLYQNQYLMDM